MVHAESVAGDEAIADVGRCAEDLRPWPRYVVAHIVRCVRPTPASALRGLDWDEPVFVDSELSVQGLASVLHRFSIGAAVVAGRNGDAGIVSERDIVAAVAAEADLAQTTAGTLAAPRLMTAAPNDRIIDVARRLLAEGVRHVAIVDRDEIVGVLSMRDLFEIFIDAFDERTSSVS